MKENEISPLVLTGREGLSISDPISNLQWLASMQTIKWYGTFYPHNAQNDIVSARYVDLYTALPCYMNLHVKYQYFRWKICHAYLYFFCLFKHWTYFTQMRWYILLLKLSAILQYRDRYCMQGRGMGCLLCIQHLIDILPQFLLIFM